MKEQLGKHRKRKTMRGKLNLPDIKTYFKTFIIKIVLYWFMKRNKWNRIEISELAPQYIQKFTM